MILFSYMARVGDSWQRIARRFCISVDALICANPQLNPLDYVIPGLILQVPDLPYSPFYSVQRGDTFFDIALHFNLTPQHLQAANPQIAPQRLKIGDLLTIPPGIGNDVVTGSYAYGYLEMMADLSVLSSRYAEIEVNTIGKSVMGKAIPVARLGSGPKQLQFNAAFHANEWITSLLLMKFLEACAKAASNQGSIRGISIPLCLEKVTLWIVPMVNPDGVELVHTGIYPQHPFFQSLLEWNCGMRDFTGWKANIRGVDLNDQFPAHWEEEQARRHKHGPGPRDYTGRAPLTEPEAEAIYQFTGKIGFERVLAFHTQGKEIYWNYRDCEPDNAALLAERFALASGYRAVKLTGSDAGFKDWFIQEFRRPGFTIEVGAGTNPLPIRQFSEIYQDALGILLEAMRAD